MREWPRVLERAVEATRTGVLITDPNRPDNPIVYANPAFERITGYSAEEVIGRNCRFLQRDDRDQPALEEVRTAIREGRDCRVAVRNYRKDGALFWQELSISPVRDDRGRITHFVGIQEDVTERKLAEERLAHLGEAVDRERHYRLRGGPLVVPLGLALERGRREGPERAQGFEVVDPTLVERQKVPPQRTERHAICFDVEDRKFCVFAHVTHLRPRPPRLADR